MSYQPIGLGTVANDGTGDPLRTGGDKINDNFVELYNSTSALAASVVANALDIATLQTTISGLLTGIVTTMLTSNTATQNGTALTNDIIAAAGQKIVIPAGDYPFGGGSIGTAAVDITSSEALSAYLEFLPGAKLTCNTSGKNSTNVFFWWREGVVATLVGGEFDGGTIAEIFVRTTDTSASPGCELTVRDVVRCHNFGWTTADSATASSAGTIGILLSNGKRLVVDNCQFDDFRSKENGTYSDQPGKCTFIQWFNAGSGTQNPCVYSITNSTFDAGAETNEGDDFDFIHMLNQASLQPCKGVIDRCTFKFHGKARRVLKYQGGEHLVTNCFFAPTDTWTAATTGATSITVTAATAANPGVFTTGSSHAIPFGTPAKPGSFAGGTWSSINGIEYSVVPVTATTFNLFGPAAALNTSGLGTYTANTGNVQRTNGQGPRLTINAATAASPGVFTTRYGVINNPHGFKTGDMVRFDSMAGGTWSTINGIDYYVVVLSSTTFSLQTAALLDTSGLGTYTGSSGSVTRVNGCSEEGMAGIDWAGANSGFVDIFNCHMNFSGFRNGVVQSTGKGASIRLYNSVLIGNRYDANRFIPDSGANEVGLPIAFSTNSDDTDSCMINCDVYGWARGVFPAGANNKITGNRFWDPRVYWVQVGTTVRDGLDLSDNTIYTRTPYSLDASTDNTTVDFHRCGEIRNWTNVKVNRNRLIQQGNTLHGTRFIAFIVNGVTGMAEGNDAPSPALDISYSSGVAPLNSGTATATAGAATLHKKKGKITTESLSTAAGDTPYTLTITNDRVVAGDLVFASVANGTNTQGVPVVGRATAGAGSITILIYNKHASQAFSNGTLIVSFSVEKA